MRTKISPEERKERQRIATAKYNEKNRDKVNAYAEKRRREKGAPKRIFLSEEEKKLRQKLYKKRYIEKNKEKFALSSQRYRDENKEKRAKYNKEWREKNPELLRIYANNRRAKVKNIGGVLSKDLKDKLFILQKGCCACCGLELGDNYHLDHILPIALGGENSDLNIQLLRASCNQKKSAKHPIDFMQSKGLLL